MRCFVDTNIIIDALAVRKPFYESARLLLIVGALKDLDLRCSTSQLTDIFYLLTAGSGTRSPEEAKAAMKLLLRCVSCVPLREEGVRRALDSDWEDFEDACVLQRALDSGCDALITRNKKDFHHAPIPVFDCEELFAYIRQEYSLEYAEVDF
ncbi:MAG: PIN domain-containing protein [Eggerthellaceae bacterium]|nr:PIN domain-containing protein [Eggerthellaceae bacterium]